MTSFTERKDSYQKGEMYRIHLSHCPPEEFERIRQQYASDYHQVDRFTTEYISFDAGSPPFDDPCVRRAFVLASDREGLTATVFGGRHLPATGGFVPPGFPGHLPGIAEPYDPAYARVLLKEAGYPNGHNFPVINFRVLAVRSRLKIFDYLSKQWHENLGVSLEIDEFEEVHSFWRSVLDDPLHLSGQGWEVDIFDPDNFLRVAISGIRERWQHPEYEKLLKRAQRSLDQPERMDAYARAERILVTEAPIFPLFYRQSHLLQKPWLKDPYLGSPAVMLFKDVNIEPH